jgi:hypothetical protein
LRFSFKRDAALAQRGHPFTPALVKPTGEGRSIPWAAHTSGRSRSSNFWLLLGLLQFLYLLFCPRSRGRGSSANTARKLGESSLHSINDIARHRRLGDNDQEIGAYQEMPQELLSDNQHLTRSLRQTHEVCDEYKDVATASLIENWIDESERRSWFLSQTLK